jgi:hypothetical protein
MVVRAAARATPAAGTARVWQVRRRKRAYERRAA